jgi:hypothetical protein
MGTGALSVSNSQIASQKIIAGDTGRVAIANSTIYGSLLQARGSGLILLTNTQLLRAGDVPSPAPAGYPALARNPLMTDPSAFPVFLTDTAGGAIVAAAINPFPDPIRAGSTITFRGDAFVQSHVPQCTFSLSYRAPGAQTFTPITTGAPCPKLARNPGDSLGSLDTTGLTAGTYLAKVEIYINGVLSLAAPREFILN